MSDQPVKNRPHEEDSGQVRRLQVLLAIEAAARRQKSTVDLSLWAVNELRPVIDYSQAVMFRLDRAGRWRVTAVSSLAGVDRHSPFVRQMEKMAGGFGTDEAVQVVDLAAKNKSGDDNIVSPFGHGLWLVMPDRHGEVFGGLLLSRARAWSDREKIVAGRLGEVVAHAFQALEPRRRLKRWATPRWLVAAIVLAVIAAMFVPVPMTALAPAEIIADDPVLVTAPIDGVIDKIMVDPNTRVRAGDILFAFEQTKLASEAELARRRELVAKARFATSRQAAFSDPKAFRQFAIARAEVALAGAEREYAEARLRRAVVHAARGGYVIYSDRKDWTGKPVTTGERVMEIADPGRVVVRVDLAVADAMKLRPGARVRVFLDANPLHALDGRLREAGYLAEQRAGAGLVYRLVVDLPGNLEHLPRIGLRGTAQVFGGKVALGFFLFRKPVSAFRQRFGF